MAEVVLMCGVAGSGKTTYALRLEQRGYVRLSIDEQIWANAGRYGIDYPADDYGQKQAEAREALEQRLASLLADGVNVVVDNAFWSRRVRDDYKRRVEEAGGAWRLIYLKATPELLASRLKKRAERFDANAAFPITAEILAQYLASFEAPYGEGEIVLDAADPDPHGVREER